MPEAIDVANTRGSWIMREPPPPCRVLIRSRSLVGPEDNRESLLPYRYLRSNRSHLPTWYPRTPLRDITNINNAVQGRRVLEQAAMAVANEARGTEPSAEDVAETSSPVEHPLPTPSTSTDVDDEADAEEKLTKSIGKIEAVQGRRVLEQAAMAVANEARGTEPSAEDVAETSSPVEHPLPTPSTSTDVDDEADAEEKLTKSIGKIEVIIVKNLKEVVQRKTLMSMR